MVTLTNILFAAAPTLDNFIGKMIYALYEAIGNFGWTVVVFTLILKTVLLPLDIWQKRATVKNNRIMKKMKPQLAKLQKQYANDRQTYGAKQMELYKKEGYSLFGACLPMLATIVIFFVVFSGFNATVKYKNELVTYNLAEAYNELSQEYGGTIPEEVKSETLLEVYNENLEGWLWIKNVYRPDAFFNMVPTYKQYSGTGIGQMRASMPDNFNETGDYNTLLGPVMEEYNMESPLDFKNWNGYLILPILAIGLNMLSMVFMKNSQPEQPVQMGPDGQPMNNAATMKMMQYIMPLMMGVFAVLYSAAFTIYMFVSALFSVIFNLIFNLINSKVEKKLEQAALPSHRR
jgi:YidC/Oxa1 family membrane protein insertase